MLFFEVLANLPYTYFSYCNPRRWTLKYSNMAFFWSSSFHRLRTDHPSYGSCNSTHLSQNTYLLHDVTHIQFACSIRLFWPSYLLFSVTCLFATPIARCNLNLAAFDNLNTVNASRSFTAVSISIHTRHDIPRTSNSHFPFVYSNLLTCYCLLLEFSSHRSLTATSFFQHSITSK